MDSYSFNSSNNVKRFRLVPHPTNHFIIYCLKIITKNVGVMSI